LSTVVEWVSKTSSIATSQPYRRPLSCARPGLNRKHQRALADTHGSHRTHV
jgi:hypothetical protein